MRARKTLARVRVVGNVVECSWYVTSFVRVDFDWESWLPILADANSAATDCTALPVVNGKPLGDPCIEPAVEVRHVVEAHAQQRLHSQRGTPSRRADQDDPAIRVELFPVVRTARIGVELEHSARRMNCSRQEPTFETLLRLAKIDQGYGRGLQFGGDRVGRQVLDMRLGRGHHLRGREFHQWHMPSRRAGMPVSYT